MSKTDSITPIQSKLSPVYLGSEDFSIWCVDGDVYNLYVKGKREWFKVQYGFLDKSTKRFLTREMNKWITEINRRCEESNNV